MSGVQTWLELTPPHVGMLLLMQGLGWEALLEVPVTVQGVAHR